MISGLLSACNHGKPTRISFAADAPLPPLPAHLARACDIPGLHAGMSVRVALAQHRVALIECAERHGMTVRFYESVRRVTLVIEPKDGR